MPDKVGGKPQKPCGNSDPFVSPCIVLQMAQGFTLSLITGHLSSLLYEAELRWESGPSQEGETMTPENSSLNHNYSLGQAPFYRSRQKNIVY